MANKKETKEVKEKLPEIQFEENNKTDSVKLEDKALPEIIPAFCDPEWHDYVMKQFKEDEVFKGNPTVDGLRRVAEQLVGEIIESNAEVVEPVRFADNGRLSPVTIKYHIKILSKLTDKILYYSEVADVFDGNTMPDYARHATSVAATRAEGRALRKLLKLRKIVCAEEADAPKLEESTMYDKIREDQINFIDVLCKQNDINVNKYVNSGSKKYKNIYEVPLNNAAGMLQYLSQLQTNHETIKEELKGYDAEWKKHPWTTF